MPALLSGGLWRRATALALALVGTTALLVPAVRATRVDPTHALRSE